jgi:hypothetical protein
LPPSKPHASPGNDALNNPNYNKKCSANQCDPPNFYPTNYWAKQTIQTSHTWTGIIPILCLPAAPDCVCSRATKSLLRAPIRCRSLRVIIALYI